MAEQPLPVEHGHLTYASAAKLLGITVPQLADKVVKGEIRAIRVRGQSLVPWPQRLPGYGALVPAPANAPRPPGGRLEPAAAATAAKRTQP